MVQKFYIVGWNQADTRYRVLKLDRTVVPTGPATADSDQEDAGLSVTEDSAVYTHSELQDLLEALGAGNVGGIQMVVKTFYGIAGALLPFCAFRLVAHRSEPRFREVHLDVLHDSHHDASTSRARWRPLHLPLRDDLTATHLGRPRHT